MILVDWRKVELLGHGGLATFQVNWDDPATDIKLDISNDEGTPIGSSPKRAGQRTGTKVLVDIPQPGVYFIKTSLVSGPGAVYTFKCKWGGASGSAGGNPDAYPSAPVATGGAGAGGGQVPNPARGAPRQRHRRRLLRHQRRLPRRHPRQPQRRREQLRWCRRATRL